MHARRPLTYRGNAKPDPSSDPARRELEALAERGRHHTYDKAEHDSRLREAARLSEAAEEREQAREREDRFASVLMPSSIVLDVLGKAAALGLVLMLLIFFSVDEDTGVRTYTMTESWRLAFFVAIAAVLA